MALSDHWESIVLPVLDALKPRTIVELGCGSGENTRRLLDWNADAVVHAIEKHPDFDMQKLCLDYPDRLVHHKALAINGLAQIDAADLVLMDGDPNWYSVHQALMVLEQKASKGEAGFPCVVIHNVAWPYGRRDAYLEPDHVPEAQRREHRKGGLSPEQEEPLEEGGVFDGRLHAVAEGGQHNGVACAVEDFLAGIEREMAWLTIPVAGGVGILASKDLEQSRQGLAGLNDGLVLSDTAARLLALEVNGRNALEAELRTEAAGWQRRYREGQVRQEELHAEIKSLKADLEESQDANRLVGQQIEGLTGKLEEKEAKVASVEKDLFQKNARLAEGVRSLREMESRNRTLDDRLEAAGQELEDRDQALDELRTRLDTLTRQEDQAVAEIRSWRTKFDALEAEASSLRARCRRLQMEAEQLGEWLDKLVADLQRHLGSWSWRLGSTLVGTARLIRGKKVVATQSLRATKIASKYREWRKGHQPGKG